ncbi:MAG: hypothetical protein AAGE01_17460 [Pseudomonadota bacterium]
MTRLDAQEMTFLTGYYTPRQHCRYLDDLGIHYVAGQEGVFLVDLAALGRQAREAIALEAAGAASA